MCVRSASGGACAHCSKSKTKCSLVGSAVSGLTAAQGNRLMGLVLDVQESTQALGDSIQTARQENAAILKALKKLSRRVSVMERTVSIAVGANARPPMPIESSGSEESSESEDEDEVMKDGTRSQSVADGKHGSKSNSEEEVIEEIDSGEEEGKEEDSEESEDSEDSEDSEENSPVVITTRGPNGEKRYARVVVK